jgi:hypothetical protein
VPGRQSLLDDAIDEGALRRCHPDPVLVRTVEKATERPASGVDFARGSGRAAFGSGSHAALEGLGKNADKNRPIFVSRFEREDDAALGGGGEGRRTSGTIEERMLHRTSPGRVALERGQGRRRAMDAGGLAESRLLSPPRLGKGRELAGSKEGDTRAPLGWGQRDAVVFPVRCNRCLDRQAGGGEVDGAGAQQLGRLREHRLAKGADEILLSESGAADRRLGLLPRGGGGPAYDW